LLNPPRSCARIYGFFADAKDEEPARFEERDSDETDEPVIVEIVPGHGAAIAAHEVRYGGPGPE
jgi:hypothetical protein